MGSQVSKQDADLLRRLRDGNIIEEVKAGDMNLEGGLIVVSCADGDQMVDEFEHLRGLFHDVSSNVSPEEKIHFFGLNGGGLLVSGHWPDPKDGEVLLKHISQAQTLKGIKTVALFTHVPCGAAGLVQWSVAMVIDQLINAKLRIKDLNPDTKVICLLHVDWGKCNGGDDRRKRTYHIKKERWLAVRREYL